MRRALTYLVPLFIALPLLVSAQTVPGGFQHDASQPIEISADSLEVRQQEQTAVFSGTVDARQGQVRMQADRLIVSYDANSEGADDAGAIRNVRAEGNVFISSAQETAQGDWAEYDVLAGSVVMGDDVALTQGPKNVLVGGSLYIDLNTGFAKLDGGAASGVASGSGRVEAIFTPPQRQ